MENALNISLIPFRNTDDGRWGFIDYQGNVVIDTILKREPTYFRDGFAIIQKDGGRLGYIADNSKTAGIDAVDATLFFEGKACIVRPNGAPEYIDKNFKSLFTLKNAMYAGVFSEGFAKYRDKNGKWGYIDSLGKTAIKPEYDYVSSFNEGLAIASVVDNNTEYLYFIDKTGKKVINLGAGNKYLHGFYDGLAVYQDTTGWGIINKEGKKVISGKASWEYLGDFVNKYATFRAAGLWGLIDETGKKVLDAKYNNNLVFSNGLAAVMQNGKWGYINIKGEYVIKPRLDSVFIPFFNEVSAVGKDDEVIFIGLDGKQVNKNKVMEISKEYDRLIDKESIVKTDLFDVNYYLDRIVGNLKEDEFDGLNASTTLDDIIERFRIDPKSLYMEGKQITMPFVKIAENFGSNLTIELTKPLNDKEAAFASLELDFEFTGRHRDKAEGFFNALCEKVKKAGYHLIKEENDVKYYTSGKADITVIKMHSQIVFYFGLKFDENAG